MLRMNEKFKGKKSQNYRKNTENILIISFVSIIIFIITSGCTNTQTQSNYSIQVNPLGDKYVGDTFIVNGTTNMPENTKLLVTVTSSSFNLSSKMQLGPFSGSEGIVHTTKRSGISTNYWEFDVDTKTFYPDHYIVKVETWEFNGSINTTTSFNLMSKTTNNVLSPTKPAPTSTKLKSTIQPILPNLNNPKLLENYPIKFMQNDISFDVGFPKGWNHTLYVTTSEPDKKIQKHELWLTSPKTQDEVVWHPTFAIYIYYEPLIESLEKASENHVTSLKAGRGNYLEFDPIKIDISGISAYEIIYRNSDQKVMDIVTIHKSKKIIIRFFSDPDTFEENTELVQNVLGSFKIV